MSEMIAHIRDLNEALTQTKVAADKVGLELRLAQAILRGLRDSSTDLTQRYLIESTVNTIDRALAELDVIERVERPTYISDEAIEHTIKEARRINAILDKEEAE